MSKKSLIMAALSMAMLAGGDDLYAMPRRLGKSREDRPKLPGNIKVVNRPTRVFKIKGIEIEAYSKKDAIKRYQHKYNK